MNPREVVRVPLDQLEPDPSQPRREFGEESLLGLARTLAESGQLHPILAYRRDGRLVILDGERRWRAAKLAKLPAVDVTVIEDPKGKGEALRCQLIANLQREDLSPMEKARSIDRLMTETQWTAAEVAVRLGLSPGNVSRTLALLALPESVQGQVESGAVPASTAYQIARAGDGETQEKLAAEVVDGGLTRDALAGKLKSRRRSRKPETATAVARVRASLGGGRSISMVGPGLDSLDRFIEWLEELLAKARKARPRGVELATFTALLRDEAKAGTAGKPRAGGAASC